MSGILQMFLAGGKIPPVIRAYSSANTVVSSATLTIDKPTGTTEGDLLICFLSVFGADQTWTDATSWTEAYDQNAGDNIRIAYKVAGASEPSTYTFTKSASNTDTRIGIIVALQAGIYDTVGTAAIGTASAGSVAITEITVAENFSRLFALVTQSSFDAQSAQVIAITGMTIVTSKTATSDRLTLLTSTVTAGATGTKTATDGTDATTLTGILAAVSPV